ncbi:MAG: glycerol-3-phosphate dehydrogenase [Pseudomonadota bacterium]
MSAPADLFVIGGGINGAGIARDAAGRGLSVILCEKDDLAEGTSSRSGKLVHGGLRYLEYYEFRLVREALIEREVLRKAAPHIIWPMRFVLPHSPDDRPFWLVRLGLFLYDHLGGRMSLPSTRSLDLRRAPEGKALKDQYTRGFEYPDCWVDDSRLVLLNALDAHRRGAKILTRTRCRSARRENGLWNVELVDQQSGAVTTVQAHALVNAGGPWVDEIISQVAGANSGRKVRLVKGSHIVTRKFWEGDNAYLIQHSDKRVIFVNPYLGDKALIGTTDIAYEGQPDDVCATDDEVEYLISAVNRYFETQLSRDDVESVFSGVRPLFDDGQGNPSAVTRDYVLEVENETDAPLLNIFGGKITTFRKLAEHALDKLRPRFPKMGEGWTDKEPLPGGDIESFAALTKELSAQFPWLPADLAHHYARSYGSMTGNVVGSARALEDLGQQFGPLLYQAEVDYLVNNEWAMAAEDILTRRTKHALHMSAAQIGAFKSWFAQPQPHTAQM